MERSDRQNSDAGNADRLPMADVRVSSKLSDLVLCLSLSSNQLLTLCSLLATIHSRCSWVFPPLAATRDLFRPVSCWIVVIYVCRFQCVSTNEHSSRIHERVYSAVCKRDLGFVQGGETEMCLRERLGKSDVNRRALSFHSDVSRSICSCLGPA